MEVRSKGKPPGLQMPDPKPCLLGIDPATGYLAFAYFDVQVSHAAQVWYQPLGWLLPQAFPPGISPQGDWVGYVHGGRFKVVTTDWNNRGDAILLDLGEVPR
jgi:hypothetical protein